MQAHLVRISTAGKQRYIFASTKRKEVVGASDLIARVDGRWIDDALARLFPGFSHDWRIESHEAELLVAGAGSATVVVKDAGKGRALVTALTKRALEEAPGLEVSGVVCPFEWNEAGGLAAAIREAHRLDPGVRAKLPPPEARFARLPIIDQCSASGLPAAQLHRSSPRSRWKPSSAVSLAKRQAYRSALDRLVGVLGGGEEQGTGTGRDLDDIVAYLGEDADWVAVVHADGNGLGAVFQDFESLVSEGADARGYADELRTFSQGVDACAQAAFRAAVTQATQIARRREAEVYGGLPAVLPLVLGGDDLTMVCDSALALAFTETYLREFAEETRRRLGRHLARVGRTALGAAAGVAIVKRHYPFHFAYELAEQLVAKEAKEVKATLGPERSAMAFHVLYESAAPDLGRLRAGATAADGTPLVAQPYVVGPVSAGTPHCEWATGRHWNDLARRVAALHRRDPETGEHLLPVTAVHDLLEALFLGRATTEARLALLRRRLGDDRQRDKALDDLGGFWEYAEVPMTGLLDAKNAAEFLTLTEAEA